MLDIMGQKRENCGIQICQCDSMLSPALLKESGCQVGPSTNPDGV